MTSGYISDPAISWLLEGDPAIRWQVKKDLLCLSSSEWLTERYRITFEGWGKRLLDEQNEKSMWSRGLYSPKWISTHYTLMLLRRLGLHPKNE